MTNKATSDALAELRRQFREQILSRLETLWTQFESLDPAAWQPGEAEALHRLLHSLTGSAGTFGMMSVSDASRAIEARLAVLLKRGGPPGADEWRELTLALNRLEALVAQSLSGDAISLGPEPGILSPADWKPLIHLVEDDAEQARYLGEALHTHGFRVVAFTDLDAFRAAITGGADERPAAVVMDMIFPEGQSAGAGVIAELGLGKAAGVPVVFVSVRGDLAARLAAYRAGASRYLRKPVDADRLCRLLDEVVGRRPEVPYRVLMVDDDTDLLRLHGEVLRLAGMEVRTLSQPLLLMEAMESFRPDVVVLDMYMPDVSGPDLAMALRDEDAWGQTPILFLSAETDMDKQLVALNLGGDDFLVKPIAPAHLVAAVTARAKRGRAHEETTRQLKTTLYEREREHQALDRHALVSVADRDGAITYANDAFCEVSGYRREELLGRNHNIVKSGIHPPEFYRDMWTTLRSGKIWRGDICNRRRDGTRYWVKSTITPFRDANGEIYQYLSIRTDITAMKESQEALRVSKERLRRGQIYANIGTWDWNINTGDLFWSERIGSLFGFKEGELATSYDNFLGAIHPDDRQAVIDAVNASVGGNVPYEIEHRVVWPDGTVRWLLERGAVIRDAAGAPLQMLGVVQDIDDRKRAELALAERERQLREAQRLAHIGNWTADLVSGELVWSDEIYRIFGHEPGSFTPSVAAFHAAVHPNDRDKVRASEETASREGRHDIIHRIVRPDGTVRHVHELAQMQLDPAGKPLRLTGTVQDVTERVEFEQVLIAAREEADRANRAKSEFLSSMSHELRTPMNAILGFSQLMGYDAALPADHKENVHEILKAGQHLLELINEVLDLSRVEAGRIDLSIEAVELCPLLDECLTLMGPLAARRGIRIDHDGLAGMIARADRTRLRQVLLNLLSNAVKYNLENGRVHIGVERGEPGRLRILVADTGPGIPPERMAELFQPFNRLGAESSGVEGTGIGLTITRRLAELMGGSVDAASEVGAGSTFWVELPQESGTAAPAAAPAEKVGAGGTATRDAAGRYDVLYVEDNPANLALVSRIFGCLQGIRLHTAHTAELGLELASAHRPDLILLDINLPGLDGYQVLSVLRADAALRDIPVVAVSANAFDGDIERGLAAGFSDYVTKPIDIEHFLAVIEKHLPDSRGAGQ